ncbi:MAG: phage/plasmid primase, P4 family [Bacilli bacterium]
MNDLLQIKELLIPYADYLGAKRDKKAGKDMYTCPLCHSGEHGYSSTGALHIGRNKDGTLSYYCHSCGSSGNIFSLHCAYYGISNSKENFHNILKSIKSNLGIYTEDYQEFKKSYQYHSLLEQSDLNPTTNVEQKDYIKFFNLALQNQPKAMEYLKKRGIIHAESITRYFQLGFIENYSYEWINNKPSKTTPVIIIPTSPHSYSWRSTTENLKKKSGTVIPLNINILQDITKRWIFIVEGEFDLFSILDITDDIPSCEFSAISVNSAVNLPRFINTYIKDNIQEGVGLIIALDGDMDTNSNVKKFVQEGINNAMKEHIPCVVADVKALYLGCKDSNEALQNDRQAFQRALINEVTKAKTLDIAQYMAKCDTFIDNLKQHQERPSQSDGTNTEKAEPQIPLYDWDFYGETQRVFNLCVDKYRYCNQEKTWYIFNGRYLKQDNKNSIKKDILTKIKVQIANELIEYKRLDKLNETSVAEQYKAEQKRIISKRNMENALEYTGYSEPIAITLTELDNAKFLNCNDITIDLTTLTYHQHNINDLCTKLAPVDYTAPLNPQAVADWNNFISEIMCNDNSMIEFIQRLFGYTLELSNREECFAILYGNTTRNGKSTLLESISGALGDYSKAVSSGTLSEKPTGKDANPEIIDLIGAKLITCGELNAETLLNDTLLKALSGNDTISARLLFSNDILNLHITGKIFANCNELPPMKNDDLLNSKRIIVVPFDRHFEEHEQNKDLKRLFATPEYRAVILAWLVEGYKRYLKYGLKANMPEKVKQAIENYRSEANTINQFLNDEDIFEHIDEKDYSQAVKITDINLYERYRNWCKDNGTFPHSKSNFKKHLKKHKNYVQDSFYKGVRYFSSLAGYKLKQTITITDERNSANPDRLVAITQRELDSYKK